MFSGNFHPLVVHFPIVLLLLYPMFILAAIFWKKESRPMEITSWFILALGLISMLVSAETGEGMSEAVKSISPEVYQAFERHEALSEFSVGLGVTALFVHFFVLVFKYLNLGGRFAKIASFIKRKSLALLFLLLLPLGLALSFAVAMTGSAGGILAYEYKVGALACLQIAHPLENIVSSVLPMDEKLQVWQDRYAKNADMGARDLFESLCQ